MIQLPRIRLHRPAAAAGLVVGAVVAVLPALAGGPIAAPAIADEAVRVDDNAFSPGSVTVEVGETVTWAWVGNNPHSVAGGPWGSSHPGCGQLTTGACGGRGETFSWTATEVGRVSYACQVHANMTGTVEVVDGEPTPSPSPSASPSPAPSPAPSASASPSASPSPSSAPSPAPSASPAPTALPTPGPSPTASPSPTSTPSSRPAPSASPTPTFGPPPPRATQPPVVVEPSGTPSTAPDEPDEPDPEVTLEAFPAPIDPDSVVATDPTGAMVEDTALSPDGGSPTGAPRFVALGLVLGTLIALVQFVLLGPRWMGPED